ncbi:zyxin-like [Glycine soja]|uniref:zyxin-like n=1 Tax=Glycine soja TaxID=3848 RepID=UPI00023D8E2B|nr:zyxin-like [Glycine soja]|eukprot:XP_006605135.1 zyxin-like [Glycine max]
MADAEPSPAGVDRLEAALAKLDAAQRRLDSQLNALLLKLPPRTIHHYPSSFVQSPPPPPPPMPTPPPSSFSAQTFLTHTPILTLPRTPLLPPPLPPPLKPTPSPTLTAPTTMPPSPAMPPPLPMPTEPPSAQPSLPPLSGSLPRHALHLPTFGHACAAIPISDNLFSAILHYGHTTAPHTKHGEH